MGGGERKTQDLKSLHPKSASHLVLQMKHVQEGTPVYWPKTATTRQKLAAAPTASTRGRRGLASPLKPKFMMGSRERKGTFLEERKLDADAARAAFNYQRCQEPKGVNSTPRKQPWARVPVHSLRQHRAKRGGDGVQARLITTLKDLKENLVVITEQIETLGQETEAVDPVPL